MLIGDFALTIKSICKSLASIDVLVDDEDQTEVCLCPKTTIQEFHDINLGKGECPTFEDLVSMLIVEEKNLME